MKLHDLKPNRGSRKAGRRVGRGSGSGRGKTAGRGEKGQKSRSGFSRKRGFEGGQMPLHRRLPKRGFTNIHRVDITAVNLSRLKDVPAGTEVTLEYLRDEGMVPHKTRLLKILGVGDLTAALTVKAHKFSKSAAAKIEAAGGQVVSLEIPKKGPGEKGVKKKAGAAS